MLTTIEAEIDVNGSVTLLEPLTISKKSQAIITLLDAPTPKKSDMRQTEATPGEGDAGNRQMDWLKANRDEYAGQYVAFGRGCFAGPRRDVERNSGTNKTSGRTKYLF